MVHDAHYRPQDLVLMVLEKYSIVIALTFDENGNGQIPITALDATQGIRPIQESRRNMFLCSA